MRKHNILVIVVIANVIAFYYIVCKKVQVEDYAIVFALLEILL